MKAWNYWAVLNQHDRPMVSGMQILELKIPTQAIGALLDRYREPLEVFEQVLLIESVAYPKLMEQRKQMQEASGNGTEQSQPPRKRRR